MRTALLLALSIACTNAAPESAVAEASPLVDRAASWVENRECALSCHTTVPLVLAAPSMDASARSLAADIADRAGRRALDWRGATPWYGGPRAHQSRGTEAVLNAVALAGRPGRARDAAFANLWAAQRADGGFDWLDFGLAPFETEAAGVYGASLAAIAARRAGEGGEPVARLRRYLRQQSSGDLGDHERLWVALAGEPVDLGSIAARQRADGGLSWARGEPADAYATALLTLALDRRGDRAAAERGRRWLRANRQPDGIWAGRSLNRDRRFNHQLATDAATGFALIALAPASRRAATGFGSR